MHAIILLIVVFFLATPGVPEHAITQSAIMHSEAECMAVREKTAHRIEAVPGVGFVSAACLETENPKDVVS